MKIDVEFKMLSNPGEEPDGHWIGCRLSFQKLKASGLGAGLTVLDSKQQALASACFDLAEQLSKPTVEVMIERFFRKKEELKT